MMVDHNNKKNQSDLDDQKMSNILAHLDASKYSLREIDIQQIQPNNHQPRQFFSEVDINHLANSIQQHGLLQPILVTQQGDHRYILLAGERRFRAVQKLKRTTIMAYVAINFPWEAAFTTALIENIQRENLTAIEEAQAYFKLLEQNQWTQQKLSTVVGKTRVYIANLVRLVKLPQFVQQLLLEKKMTTGQARPLISLIDQPLVLKNLVTDILKKNWTSAIVEKKVRQLINPNISTNLLQRGTDGHALQQLAHSLIQQLNTKIEIKKNKMTIHYQDINHLNQVLQKMNLLETN